MKLNVVKHIKVSNRKVWRKFMLNLHCSILPTDVNFSPCDTRARRAPQYQGVPRNRSVGAARGSLIPRECGILPPPGPNSGDGTRMVVGSNADSMPLYALLPSR